MSKKQGSGLFIIPPGTHEEQGQGTEGNICGQGSSIWPLWCNVLLRMPNSALAFPPQDDSTQKGKGLDAQVPLSPEVYKACMEGEDGIVTFGDTSGSPLG